MTYTIKEVAKLTGVRPHTLRAWEQRHGLVTPLRDEGNTRYYGEEDLRELSAIALLNKHGFRISKIAAMSREERDRAVAEASSLNLGAAGQLDALTLSVVEMDEYRFSLLLDTHTEQRGFEETMLEVIYPFLDKLGVLFFTGSVTAVQEAFVVGLLRRKIMAATDRLDHEVKDDLPTFALFLPEGDRQDQSILFVQYLLKKRGYSAIYLGADTTPSDLSDACAATSIDYLFTMLSTTYVARPVDKVVEDTLAQCPDVRLLVAGYQATLHDFSDYPNVRTIMGLQDLLTFVESLSKTEDRSTVPS